MRRVTEAHTFFVSKIDEHVMMDGQYDEDRLETLFETLKEGLAIVSIELEGGDDPQTIFETLNSRGVELSQADLLRNFIFQRAKGLGQTASSLNVDALYEKHWLPLDRAFWSQIASRGRLSRQRLEWMLTDHLSMHIGEIVSVETLFERYRRWIFNRRPFDSTVAELNAITATAEVEKRLFNQLRNDTVGTFGRFADAFDVSTAMPLVVYLSINSNVGDRLPEALDALESYIIRRDICGLTTKNYNRFFVGIVARLRSTDRDKVDELVSYLSTRTSDLERWPDDSEWRRGWLDGDQYKGPRQPRLRYIFEKIEKAKRSALSEEIEIKSALTIEHIMPQKWRAFWPIPGFENVPPDQFDPVRTKSEAARDAAVNKLGNLTLLTSSLNTTVSNGPFAVKMPAVRAHSSLALNRELNCTDKWDETKIAERGASLFDLARKIWIAHKRDDATRLEKPNATLLLGQKGQRTGPNASDGRPGTQEILLLLRQRGAFSESTGVDREWLDEQLIDKVEGVHSNQAVSFALIDLRDKKGKLDSQGGRSSGSAVGKVWLLNPSEDNDNSTLEMLHFWEEFLSNLKLDDSEQPIPGPARLGYLCFMLPAQSGSSWLTVYRNMKRGEVGVTLSAHQNTAGDYARQVIVDEWGLSERSAGRNRQVG